MPFIEIQQSQDLKLGLYVKLEGSWFSHPFPTNTFKIKSASDLEILQNLKKVRILYDPERSDSESSQDVQIEEPAIDQDGSFEEPSSPDLQDTPNSPPPIEEAALSEIIDRRQDFQEFREHLKKVEGSYHKVLGQSSELFRQIGGGKKNGVQTAEMIVANLQNVLQNPHTAMTLVDVVGGNGVTWGLSEHALNVCVLSLVVGRQMGLSPDELLGLGMGALFHDVGYRSLPMKVQFLTAGMKVQADPEMLSHHPERGCQLMQTFPEVSPTVLEIIAQHHERLDGSGFPKGMNKETLSALSKIVMVADYFDELCNSPTPESSLTSHAALSYFYRHVVFKGESTKFCERVVQALVHAIGIYPPGSLVELTDGFLGVVTSVNFESPARPIVLLYAPWLCRTDGMMVNLAKETKLNVKKALHPKEVDTNVLGYLSPRRLAMFVHATDPTASINKSKKKVLAGARTR